jgi:hypothetical protein
MRLIIESDTAAVLLCRSAKVMDLNVGSGIMRRAAKGKRHENRRHWDGALRSRVL